MWCHFYGIISAFIDLTIYLSPIYSSICIWNNAYLILKMVITRWYDMGNSYIFLSALCLTSLKDVHIILWKDIINMKKEEEGTLQVISLLWSGYFLR